MKVDGGIGALGASGRWRNRQPSGRGEGAEDLGLRRHLSAETSHDPFFPLLLAAEHTERIELGTGIAVAFARSPMTLANTA